MSEPQSNNQSQINIKGSHQNSQHQLQESQQVCSHDLNQDCNKCIDIKTTYQGKIVSESQMQQDEYVDKLFSIQKKEDNDKSNFMYYFKNFMKCFVCIFISHLTFGLGSHFKFPSLYLKHLSFFATFIYSCLCLTSDSVDNKVTFLIFFLMGFSLVLNTLMLFARKIYRNEHQNYNLDDYIKNYLSNINDSDNKKKFKDYLKKKYSHNQEFKNEIQSKESNKKVLSILVSFIEVLLFNSGIAYAIYTFSDPSKTGTVILIILFQIYFSYDIIILLSWEIHIIKDERLFLLKFIQDVFSKSMENGDLNKQKEITVQVFNHVRIQFYWQKDARKIAGATASVFILAIIMMGFWATLDNLALNNSLKLKEDKEFISVYITYMVFLMFNAMITLFKKYSINNVYIKIRKQMEDRAQELEKQVFKLQEVDENRQDQKQIKDTTVAMCYINQSATNLKKEIKKNCERVIGLYRVNLSLALRLTGLLVFLTVGTFIN